MFTTGRIHEERLAAVVLLVLGVCATRPAHAEDSNAEFQDLSGFAVAHGDFNGDGYQDVAVGAREEDIGSVPSAGAVDVLYGGASGLGQAARQFWNADTANVEGVAEARAYFGTSLASIDFNADGYDDLAVGVPGATVNGETAAGAVSVLYGSPSGLSATFVSDQLWNQDSPAVEETAEYGDSFGSTLAAGDFNADGFGDLAIGAPGEVLSAKFYAGGVNVIYGSVSGLSATAVHDQRWNQDVNNVEDVVEAYDYFGSALATADFNADGYDDLAVGVQGESVNGVPSAGAVNVIYGSGTGLSATTVPDQRWNQDSAEVEDAAEESDCFGLALATGDFNDDGYADLAIGAPNEKLSGQLGAGAVNVIYGSGTGLSTTAVRDQRWDQDKNNVEDVVENGDRFGSSLTSADFNADGYDDLAIGVPSESVDSKDLAGSVNVLYGAASGLSATTVPDQRWEQNIADVEDAAERGDNFGRSLTAADFNADGYADLAIGVPYESVVCFSGEIDNAGAFNVLYGAVPGLSAMTVPDQFWTQPCP